MTQMNLILPRVQQKAAEMMDRFLDVLNDGRWHRAKDLSLQLHTSDRVIRMMAEKSAGRVIGSDQGYKLIRYATLAEIDETENRLRSQARRMLHRVLEIRKARASYQQGVRVA